MPKGMVQRGVTYQHAVINILQPIRPEQRHTRHPLADGVWSLLLEHRLEHVVVADDVTLLVEHKAGAVALCYLCLRPVGCPPLQCQAREKTVMSLLRSPLARPGQVSKVATVTASVAPVCVTGVKGHMIVIHALQPIEFRYARGR